MLGRAYEYKLAVRVRVHALLSAPFPLSKPNAYLLTNQISELNCSRLRPWVHVPAMCVCVFICAASLELLGSPNLVSGKGMQTFSVILV